MNVRPYQSADLTALHRINEENAPAVGSVSADELDAVIAMANWTLVVEVEREIAGFVVCLVEGKDYGSLNYTWISERYPSFAYVDRIAISAAFQNRGVGRKLYAALETHIGDQRPMINLEVNEQPPNPGSVRFHHAIGYEDIGRRATEDGSYAVVYMSKRLT